VVLDGAPRVPVYGPEFVEQVAGALALPAETIPHLPPSDWTMESQVDQSMLGDGLWTTAVASSSVRGSLESSN
jgi:hypothetical protein